MLLEGHRLKEDGIDIVVGLVETHGRRNTDALVEGMEVIPRRKITYRGIEIGEMDLDAVLARRPSVVLVDELAHTNPPGSKNNKRYEDIESSTAGFSAEVAALSFKTAGFSAEVAALSFKTAVFSAEVAALSFKTAVFSAEVAALSFKTAVFSAEVAALSFKTAVFSAEVAALKAISP